MSRLATETFDSAFFRRFRLPLLRGTKLGIFYRCYSSVPTYNSKVIAVSRAVTTRSRLYSLHGFFSLSDQKRYLNLKRNWKKFPLPAARFENGNLNFSCHQRPFYFPYVPPSSLFSHVIPDLLLQGGAAFCNISASCIHTLTAKWLKVLAIVGKCGTTI